jgi:hypothetical protein
MLSRHGIPVEISDVQFQAFGLALRKSFNHILMVLFWRSQWKALPINKNPARRSRIHPHQCLPHLPTLDREGFLRCCTVGFSGPTDSGPVPARLEPTFPESLQPTSRDPVQRVCESLANTKLAD